MSLEALVTRLTKMERVLATHEIELKAMASTINELRLSNHNAAQYFRKQLVATREHVDVIEKTLSSNRRGRRSTRGAKA